MAQSLSKIYVHLIFHIKTTSPQIRDKEVERIHSYIGMLVNATECSVIQVGGVSDHVHILFVLSKNVCLMHVVEEVKRNSSRWIKSLDAHYAKFEWQGGYGAFSVSQSVVDKTLQYIKRQREHHKKQTFREEYIEFLKTYNVDYNDGYVFRD